LFLEVLGTRVSLYLLGALKMTDRIFSEDNLLLPGRR